MNEDVMSSENEYSSSKHMTGGSSSVGVAFKLGGNYDSQVRFSAPNDAEAQSMDQIDN